MVGAREIVLSCQGCGKKFRITVDAGVRLEDPLPCPSCKTTTLSDGIEKPEVKHIFGRSHTPRIVEAQAPIKTTQGRQFRDVTKVSMDRSTLPQQRDLAEKIAPPIVNKIAPLPENDRPSAKTARREKNEEALKTIGINSPPVHPKPPTESVQTKEVPTTPSAPQSGNLSKLYGEKDLDLGLTLRNENQEEFSFDKERLKHLLRSRTWLGAFEAKHQESWISLEKHPAIPLLERELKSEAEIALVSISQEFDRAALSPIVPDDDKEKKGFSKLYYIIPMAIFVVLASAYFYTEAFPPTPPEPTPVVIPPPQSAIDAAVGIEKMAQGLALSASSMREKSRQTLMTMSENSLAKSNFGDALDTLYELERRDPSDAIVVEKLVNAYLGSGGFRDARRALVRLVSLEGKSEKSEKLFNEALTRDPLLKPKVLEIGVPSGVDVDLVKKLGGGKSISFKFKKDGKNVYAFKPSQFEWEDGWEGEVAAYMFCEIATCGFRVPRSRPAKISYQNFFKLYPMGSESQKIYAKRFENLRWKTEVIDGKKVRFLYGVLKDWIPRMIDWPIEYTNLWTAWLDPKVPVETKVAVLPELDFLKQKNKKLWRRLRRDMNVPVGLVAGELSNLMGFDYLTNNWDRFSEKEDFYGVNNQFSDGHFLSLDNGASFGLRHSLRVEKRFQSVGRFSRSFVASVRICDEKIDPYLFPSQTKTAKRKLVFYHERRKAFLENISLALKNNEKNNILRFE